MRRSFIGRNNSWIFIFAIIFAGSLCSWTQEPIQHPPAGNPSNQPAPGTARTGVKSSDLTPKVVEDFSTPALTSSTVLGKTEATPLGFNDDPAFTSEIVRVQWRPADPIDLYIVKPVGVKKPPVILYLQDYPTETDKYHDAAYCRLLTRQGYAAVGFVGALTGQRYQGRPMKDWFVSELPEALATSAHDIQMILNYLAQRGDFDMDRVGMFGDGSGATIAILAAAVDPRIKSLDLTEPWGDWPDWVAESRRVPDWERARFQNTKWMEATALLDPVKWLPELKTPKIRLQFVNDASVAPPEVQKKIEAAAPANAQIVHYDGLAAFRKSVAGGKGFEWIQGQMRGGDDYRASGEKESERSPSPEKN